MEKEFIPYEQALALKELGFDEPCLACVGENNEVIIRVGDYRSFSNKKPEDIIERDFYNTIITDFNSYANDTASAPTFSQAFRFFREKYGLSSCINLKMQNSKRIIWYNICELDNRLVKSMYFKNNSKGFFKSHEEAEIKCLKKLIEIVKTKEVC